MPIITTSRHPHLRRPIADEGLLPRLVIVEDEEEEDQEDSDARESQQPENKRKRVK